MKLNHLSLAVPDVENAAVFMEKFFGFKTTTNKGGIIVVMEGADNFILVLTTQRPEDSPYPADFHFGFILNNENEVHLKYEQLLAAGQEIPRPPSKIRNSFGFYFHMPGGVMMEVNCNL